MNKWDWSFIFMVFAWNTWQQPKIGLPFVKSLNRKRNKLTHSPFPISIYTIKSKFLWATLIDVAIWKKKTINKNKCSEYIHPFFFFIYIYNTFYGSAKPTWWWSINICVFILKFKIFNSFITHLYWKFV